MAMKIACAPCSWGVENSEQGGNPSWAKVLVEAREAGYEGIELGPVGYFPEDPAILASSLRVRGMKVCAGNLHGDFSCPDSKEKVLVKARRVIDLLSALGVDKLIIMDRANAARDAYVGHGVIAPRLKQEQLQAMISTITEVAEMAAEKGVRTLLHPSSGGFVAFSDEIASVLNAIPAERLGLCLDIGHLFIDGMKPEEFIRRYANRLEHLHFKDVDGQQLHNAMRDRCGMTNAFSKGLTRPLGEGSINFSNVFKVLKDIDYQGWIVVEQERAVTQLEHVKVDMAKSRGYLAEHCM
ncbi:myo-inositol catabolism protein [Photobacterium rosenbergii]|uniref:Myo-inositol catabolism protein n=1 Tax=Photobacterium rosenbergii TaxID=294936 RepID=A0A2T3NLD3_9GAMM|nr:sugar phosphate isomerase/epimerase [Photobacterium rosenbergii]PSW16283.1 myo-inositol catabolism protein [Photobacterium rosenbergii]